jgi:hypothetical protein
MPYQISPGESSRAVVLGDTAPQQARVGSGERRPGAAPAPTSPQRWGRDVALYPRGGGETWPYTPEVGARRGACRVATGMGNDER